MTWVGAVSGLERVAELEAALEEIRELANEADDDMENNGLVSALELYDIIDRALPRE